MRPLAWMAACSLLFFMCSTGRCPAQQRHLLHLRRAPAPIAAQPAGGPNVEFVQVAGGARVFSANGAGVLPMGSMSPVGGKPTPGVQVLRQNKDYGVQTTIGIRLGNNAVPGLVTLKAWLSSPADPCQVYLDHVHLSTVPTTVPLESGSDLTRHLLEVRVPESANVDQEQLKAMILFEIVKN